MNLLVVSHSYDDITHGPAKFIDILKNDNQYFSDFNMHFLAHDMHSEIPNVCSKYDYHLRRPFGIFWEFAASKKILEWVLHNKRTFNPDVILFVDAILGFHTSRHLDIPCLGMVNDNEYMDSTLLNIKLTKEWIVKSKSRLQEKATCHSMDHVIVNSNYLQKQIINQYKLPKSKVTRLYKAIEVEKMVILNQRHIIETEVRVLFVKNDWQRGGLIELVSALSLIEGYIFTISIVGPHQKDKEQILSLERSSNVHLDFKGARSQQEVFSLMTNHDIFCVPSRREALGVANIEALSLKIPVISSSAGGIPEVTSENTYAWLSKPNDHIDLARTFKLCLTNEDERVRKTELGRAYVINKFGEDQMLSELYNIISHFT